VPKTRNPHAASSRAISRPIPDETPVINAILFVLSDIIATPDCVLRMKGVI
jgi:hypothetical protein